MPNVLILGATGYLGMAVGQTLLHTGNYAVWGLARSAEKARVLALNEITPVVGDASKPSSFTSIIDSAHIDCVIDCTSAYEDAKTILDAIVAVGKARLANLAKESATAAPKLGLVYTSGAWVYGSPSGPMSDLHPIGTSMSKGVPAKATAWRVGHEQAILASRDVLDVAILRPGQLYGRSSSMWGMWWGELAAAAKSGSTKAVQLPIGKEARPGIVHVDDVAAGFQAAVDRIDGRLGSWPVFDLVTETVGVQDVMDAVAESLGFKGTLEYAGTQGNPILEALGLRTNTYSARAKTVLGWEGNRKAFVLNLPLYVQAWEAAQGSH